MRANEGYTGSLIQPALTLKYTYDKNGNRKTLDDGINTATTNYSYDALNRLTSLTNPAGQAFSFDYDVLNRRSQLTRPNGITTDYTYDALGQLLNLSHTVPTDPVDPARSSFSYTYDPAGSRDTLTTARAKVAVAQTNLSYIYDDLNRLTQATRPLVGDPDETFQYDPVGNRLSRDGQAVNSTFDDGNRLLEDTGYTYVYDVNGNLTQKTDKSSGEVTDYTWNVQNQLIKVEVKPDLVNPPTKIVQYKYDGLGRRIQKNIDGVVTTYIYDSEDILLEYDGANILQARYTHGPGIDEPLLMDRNNIHFYYHGNVLGSITELTDDTGTIVQSYIYDSFGNTNVFDQNGAIISIENGIVNPFSYTGREFDIEASLYYYRARYYDSNMGRFISEDPIRFSGGDINLYGYVTNSPVNFVDPLGLDAIGIGAEFNIPFVGGLEVGIVIFDGRNGSSFDIGGFYSVKKVLEGEGFSGKVAATLSVTPGCRNNFEGGDVELFADIGPGGVAITGLRDGFDGDNEGLALSLGPAIGYGARGTLTAAVTIGDVVRGIAQGILGSEVPFHGDPDCPSTFLTGEKK